MLAKNGIQEYLKPQQCGNRSSRAEADNGKGWALSEIRREISSECLTKIGKMIDLQDVDEIELGRSGVRAGPSARHPRRALLGNRGLFSRTTIRKPTVSI